MTSTARTLRDAASFISSYGLHTGEQFAAVGLVTDRLDVCAAIYQAAENDIPAEFYTDESTSLALIESSAAAMDAIRAVSAALDTEPCDTDTGPDFIEHVANWARTAAIGETDPPTQLEVMGRLIRTAEDLEPPAAILIRPPYGPTAA